MLDSTVRGMCQLSKLPPVTVIEGEAELDAMFTARREEALQAQALEPDAAGAELAVVARNTAKKAERKLNLKERLEICTATEKQRLTFGKVRCPLSARLPHEA
jgi:hypothetical protein